MSYWIGKSKGDPRTATITISTALESLNLTALQWAINPPTLPGWYWGIEVRTDACKIVEVVDFGDGVLGINDDSYLMSDFYKWLGPLPEPEEPK